MGVATGAEGDGVVVARHGGRGENRRVRIATGRLFGVFSFDVGYEIDLERLRALLPGGSRPAPGAADGKMAPARAQYPSPPLRVPMGGRPVVLVERPFQADVELRVHEFGAVSVLFGMSLDGESCAGLPALTAALTTGSTLESEARGVLHGMLPRLAPAISRPQLAGNDLVEDYYVLQVSRFEPATPVAALIGDHRDLVARIVHCEPQPLSTSETDSVLRTAVTYTPNDLVVTDWNVALLYDEDYRAVLDVLELLNVQLLELRFLDTMLDRRIGALYEHVARRRRLFSFRSEVVRVRELSELRLDAATLRERMINALKLLGDLYLTKIYALTADRLHLGEWQRSVDGKLELVQKIADVFGTRGATARAELLELTIIILIAVEIALFLVR